MTNRCESPDAPPVDEDEGEDVEGDCKEGLRAKARPSPTGRLTGRGDEVAVKEEPFRRIRIGVSPTGR